MENDWRHSAACVGTDLDLWFPPGHGLTAWYKAPAIAICDKCPVQQQCLDDALRVEVMPHPLDGRDQQRTAPERHGIRGGLTPTERHRYAGTHRPGDRTR